MPGAPFDASNLDDLKVQAEDVYGITMNIPSTSNLGTLEDTGLLQVQDFTKHTSRDLAVLFGRQTTESTDDVDIDPEENLKYIGEPASKMTTITEKGLVKKMDKPYDKIKKPSKFMHNVVPKPNGSGHEI